MPARNRLHVNVRVLMKITLANLVLVSLLVMSAVASAQQSASSGLVGQVTDSSQAAIPGATVTVTNVGTNAQRTTVTDGEGRFSIPALPPASYHIKVELQGFQTAELPNFVLRQGETARPTITLGVATISEAITVTGESPLLQTQSASVGQVISEKQIEDLPLNGRSVLSLASLSAGVTPRNFERNTQFGRRNQFITVEGGRDSSTNYTIDGVYVRSLRFNNLSLAPPIDAVQEVSLLRNSFSTEYGQGQAVVSIVTKSGSNQLHGSAYEFARSDRFDCEELLRADQAGLQAESVWRHRRRAADAQQVLRVWRLRRPAHRSGAAVPGQRREPGIPRGQFLVAGHADSRSADGSAVPEQHHPGEPVLALRAHSHADDSRTEFARREQLHHHQELRGRLGYGNASAPTRRSTTTTACFSGSCTTKDRSSSPRRSPRPTCRSGAGTSRSDTPGSSRARGSTSSASATTTRIT